MFWSKNSKDNLLLVWCDSTETRLILLAKFLMDQAQEQYLTTSQTQLSKSMCIIIHMYCNTHPPQMDWLVADRIT
jgi:hypothetical protein